MFSTASFGSSSVPIAFRIKADLSALPEHIYVQRILASQHDENVAYAALDNHQNGDFKPYLMKTAEKGHWTHQPALSMNESDSAFSKAVALGGRSRAIVAGQESRADGKVRVKLENAEEMIFKITDQRTTQEPVAIHDILENVLVEARKHVDAHMAGQSLPTPAIPTGFHDLDKIFAGK